MFWPFSVNEPFLAAGPALTGAGSKNRILPDAYPMTLLAIIVLFGSASLLVRQRFRLRADESVLYGGLLAFLEIILFMQALGLMSRLKPEPAWIATGTCAAINITAALWRCPFRPLRKPWLPPLLMRPVLLIVFVTAGLRFLLAWMLPPESWDGLGYHLPFVVRWVQQGNLDLTGFPGAQRYFAWNGELASTWLALLGGNLAWAKLFQILTLPMLTSVGSVLGRRLAGLRWAWPCAVAIAGIPVVLIQSGFSYVDVLYAAFWLTAAAAAVALAQTGHGRYFWAFAGACGLALGTKSTIYFLAPLILPLAFALWKQRRKYKPAWHSLILGLVLIVLAGAGSYIRNVMVTGNPIFPFGFSVAGIPLFKGILSSGDMPASIEHWFVPASWAWIVYPFWEKIRDVAGYTHLNGFGPLFALGWALLPLGILRSWKRRDGTGLAFLGLVPLTLLIFFWMQPVRIPRYMIFLAPLPIIGLAMGFRRPRGCWRSGIAVVWSLAILLGCIGVGAYMGRGPGPRYAWTSILSGRGIDAWTYYQKQYPALGQAWHALDQKTKPGDGVVINYSELMLPWWGMPPRARVQVVVFGDYPFPGVPSGRTEREWVAAVLGLSPRWVVVWSPSWNRGGEERLVQALERDSGRFRSIGRWDSPGFGWVVAYEVDLRGKAVSNVPGRTGHSSSLK
jgi:hypothetical protein